MSTQFIKIQEGKLRGIKLNSLWLRERLSGEDYIDQNNLQRLYEPSLLDDNLSINKYSLDDDFLKVEFTDGSSGKFSINDLYDEINFIDVIPEKKIWDEKHNLKIGTIADLIEYRNLNETTIQKVAQCNMPTEYGDFELHTFKDSIDNQLHFALKKGEIKEDEPTLVRVHLHNTFSDLLGSTRGIHRSMTLADGMRKISEDGGVLVLLGKEEHIESQVRRFAAEDRGERPTGADWQGSSRTIGVGSQILASMGVHKMRLLSKPIKYHALSGYGLEVVEYVHD